MTDAGHSGPVPEDRIRNLAETVRDRDSNAQAGRHIVSVTATWIRQYGEDAAREALEDALSGQSHYGVQGRFSMALENVKRGSAWGAIHTGDGS